MFELITILEDQVETKSDTFRWSPSGPVERSTGSCASFSLKILPPVPDSFWKGLKECNEGRHVDMEKALEEPPPES